MTNLFGEDVYPTSPASLRMSRLDFFLLMFPENQLDEMVTLTNRELKKRGAPDLTNSELLNFFGLLILSTRFEFGSRSELCSTTAPSKYRPAPSFGKCGVSRKRVDVLFTAVKWIDQPDERPDGMTSEAYRRQRVKDFVNRFNLHRATKYSPSESICVDESISRWYGLGGYWINIGIPQYVAIDRKPENGCEIQNAGDGVSGVMMRLKLVDSLCRVAARCATRKLLTFVAFVNMNKDRRCGRNHGFVTRKMVAVTASPSTTLTYINKINKTFDIYLGLVSR